MTIAEPLLVVDQLCFGHPHAPLWQQLSFEVHAGESIGILGPNGSGKTSLLHALGGLLSPRSGRISLLGKPVTDWPSVQLAQQMGLLFQSSTDEMPATVVETVELGRLPHQRAWQSRSDTDSALVQQALDAMALTALAHRELTSLSGGERQRVAIALLLAQSPRVLLLDEPSNHLDISFQIKTLQLLCDLVKKESRALLMATHDINLAARFCDRILLLDQRGSHLFGPADDILTESHLSDAFAFQVRRFENDGQICFMPADIVRR